MVNWADPDSLDPADTLLAITVFEKRGNCITPTIRVYCISIVCRGTGTGRRTGRATAGYAKSQSWRPKDHGSFGEWEQRFTGVCFWHRMPSATQSLTGGASKSHMDGGRTRRTRDA